MPSSNLRRRPAAPSRAFECALHCETRRQMQAGALTTQSTAQMSIQSVLKPRIPYQLGDFPNPFMAAAAAVHARLPGVPSETKLASVHIKRATSAPSVAGSSKAVNYVKSDVCCTGNSQFHDLTEEEQDEIGGLEYRVRL